MIRKMRAKVLGGGTIGALQEYLVTLIRAMSWKVALTLALMLCLSVSQGAQLLLLVPLMQLVGLDVQQGSVGWLTELVSSIFAAIGVQPTLVTVLSIFVLFTTGLALITRWQAIYNYKLQQDFVAVLRQRLYRAIANADWLTFLRTRSSDFTHALTTELDRVGTATLLLLRLGTNAVLTFIYVLFALQLSAVLTAMVLVFGAGLLLLFRRHRREALYVGKNISLITSGLYAASIEHLAGMKTAKSYGVEERSADFFSRLTNRVAQVHLDAVRNYSGTTFWATVGSVVLLCVVLFVSLEILGISTAELLLLLFLFYRIIPLVNDNQQIYQQFLNELPAFTRVMEMQAQCEAAAEPKAERAEEIKLQDSVRFEGVSFAYGKDGEAPAIANLDLKIRAGETTAIVGPSGAGKSTIADLVMGLLVPNQGRVLVNEVPLGPERIRSWRKQIGYVAQDTFLFNDTVRANLLWACPEANNEEIKQALKLAAAEEFVFELPNGIKTVLGDRGVRLSGGERQRLALARALLRRPSLMILDEATSALDSENEKRIQGAIEELHGHMTILVITHRLSTVRGADIIYVLEERRLVEYGNWDALVGKENGRFAALCRAQGIER